MKLQGRKAVITGGSRGIGRSVCLAFAQEGADVAFCYRASAGRAEETAAQIRGMGRRACAVRADMAERAQVGDFIRTGAEALGGIDILVNCAGVFRQNHIEDISDAEWYESMRVNLDSAFFACRAAVPFLKQSPYGRVINMSSQAALSGTAHGAHYGASKAGLLGLSYCLARELGPDRITVNAVLPGRIETDMLAYATEERREQWLAGTPLGYLGDAGDVAGLCVFLASDEGRYITGAKINVNGGLLMG